MVARLVMAMRRTVLQTNRAAAVTGTVPVIAFYLTLVIRIKRVQNVSREYWFGFGVQAVTCSNDTMMIIRKGYLNLKN